MYQGQHSAVLRSPLVLRVGLVAEYSRSAPMGLAKVPAVAVVVVHWEALGPDGALQEQAEAFERDEAPSERALVQALVRALVRALGQGLGQALGQALVEASVPASEMVLAVAFEEGMLAQPKRLKDSMVAKSRQRVLYPVVVLEDVAQNRS